MLLLVGAPHQCGGVDPPRFLPLVGGADRVQQDRQWPGVRRHVVGLGGPLSPVDVGQGRECPLPSGAVPDRPSASGQDVRPVPSGVAVYDGLVSCRLQYQRLPLLRPGRGCAIARTPDAGAPAECGMPRV